MSRLSLFSRREEKMLMSLDGRKDLERQKEGAVNLSFGDPRRASGDSIIISMPKLRFN
jgi:hypothetical protein